MRKMCVAAVAVVAAAGPAAAAPGDLISATPVAGAPDGASAYRIRYRSTDTLGAPITVTGMVVVPRGPMPVAGRNVVGWAHGSFGVAEKCAPLPMPDLFDNIAGLSAMLAQGFVVAATDYQGLGNPGPHPYLVGNGPGQTVIDAVRAARSVPRAGTSARTIFWGESQGAHAALWAAKIAPRYAPELRVAGVAAAAPPTDLKANLTGGSNATVRALLTAFTADSWSKIYGVPLADLGRPATQRLIRRLAANNCVTLDGFRLRTKIGLLALTAQLKGVDITRPPAWGRLIAQNSVAPAGLTKLPVLIAQEADDPVVGAAITRKFAGQLCRAGGTLRYIAWPGGHHVDVGKRTAPEAVKWMSDRFADRPAPSDCTRLG